MVEYSGKKADAQLIKRLERRHEAMEYRKQGLSYRVIAEKLDVSHQTIKNDVKTCLAELAADNIESADALRQLILERLDFALEGLHDRVAEGDPQAVNALVAVGKETAKLLGLYAPERRDTRNINLSFDMTKAVNILKQAEETLNAPDIEVIEVEVVNGGD